jgi:hypothetical protein
MRIHEPGPRRLAVLASARSLELGGPTTLRLTLRYDSVYAQHTFGRVRLHLAAANPTLLDRLPLSTGRFHVAGPFAAGCRAALYDRAFGPERAPRSIRAPSGAKSAGASTSASCSTARTASCPTAQRDLRGAASCSRRVRASCRSPSAATTASSCSSTASRSPNDASTAASRWTRTGEVPAPEPANTCWC